ncbi:MAG: hypothetical protein FalmKO_15160 [Falsiruegeria mediterranea]
MLSPLDAQMGTSVRCSSTALAVAFESKLDRRDPLSKSLRNVDGFARKCHELGNNQRPKNGAQQVWIGADVVKSGPAYGPEESRA